MAEHRITTTAHPLLYQYVPLYKRNDGKVVYTDVVTAMATIVIASQIMKIVKENIEDGQTLSKKKQ